jgi:hypothetical protein
MNRLGYEKNQEGLSGHGIHAHRFQSSLALHDCTRASFDAPKVGFEPTAGRPTVDPDSPFSQAKSFLMLAE